MAEGYSWHRRYDGTVTDAKFAEAKAISGQSKSVVLATWDCICESANLERRDGAFVWTPRRVAAVLEESAAAIEPVFAAFAELGMIADGVVVNWKKRQPEFDPTAAQRQAELRERRRLAGLGDAQPELPLTDPGEAGKSSCHGGVTARHGEVTVSESDLDSDLESSSSSVVVPFARAERGRDDDDELFKKISKALNGTADVVVCRAGVREVRGLLAEGCDLERDVLGELAGIAKKVKHGKSAKLSIWAPFIGVQIRARRDGRLAAQKGRGVGSPEAPAQTFVAEGTLEWAARVAAGHSPARNYCTGPHGRKGWYFRAGECEPAAGGVLREGV